MTGSQTCQKRIRDDLDESLQPPELKRSRSNIGELYDSFATTEVGSQSQSQSQSTLNHDLYTVGWICALAKEKAAAIGMLDGPYQMHYSGSEKNPNDTNVYTLGRIGGTNVVITCIGDMGTENAATVANNMRWNFTSLRVLLLVGIGGGIPSSSHDIRLGDVIVGTKIIQHDTGKLVQGGSLERTSTPWEIQTELKKIVTNVQAAHITKAPKLSAHISDMLKKYPDLQCYALPAGHKDRLFQNDYEHQPQRHDCTLCDTGRLVNREDRLQNEPSIHYGTIASGNQVIKHGHSRDDIASKLSSKPDSIMCFEMEAAGVFRSFPCIVIRGISDYCDSHKNDVWQEYAAATAAGYAKELLSIIDINDIPQTRWGVVPPEKEEQQQTAALRNHRKKLMDSLKFDTMGGRLRQIKPSISRTCKWLFEHKAFRIWQDQTYYKRHLGMLWIKGKPGAGKSTLMKFASTEMAKKKAENRITISFFFNIRGDILQRSDVGMYRALLYQLLQKAPVLQEILDDMSPKPPEKNALDLWEIEELQELLLNAVSLLGDLCVTCFVDGLDEVDIEQARSIIDHFEEVGKQSHKKRLKFYVCVSSRHYPQVHSNKAKELVLEDQPEHTRDIEKYVKAKLQGRDDNRTAKIRGQLLQKAAGVFLWAVVVVQILNHKVLTPGRIWDAEQRLEELPSELNALFKDILSRDTDNKDDVILCLQWILFAKRPLTPEEYCLAAMAGRQPEQLSKWNPDDYKAEDFEHFVISSCKGLAEAAGSRKSEVQFIHGTVREFLLRHGGLAELWPDHPEGGDLASASHDRLKRACAAAIAHDPRRYLRDGESPYAVAGGVAGLRAAVLARSRLLGYAARHVLDHADAALPHHPQGRFLRRAFPLPEWLALAALFEPVARRRPPPQTSLAHVLAAGNYPRLIAELRGGGGGGGGGGGDDGSGGVHVEGGLHHYALFAALRDGHRAAAAALLRQDEGPVAGARADEVVSQLPCGSELKVKKGQTVLTWAIQGGHEALARLLISSEQLDLDAKDDLGLTPLSYATSEGQDDVVRLLIEKGARIDSRDELGRTALFWAVQYGRESITTQLLERGAYVEVKDNKSGQTPLSKAAELGHASIVRQLLEYGGCISTRDSQYKRTPLLWAVRGGYQATVEVLLKWKEKPDMEVVDEEDELTALGLAVDVGSTPLVNLLLAYDADIEARNKSGQTPLMMAVQRGDGPTAKVLVARGADVEAGDKSGETPLTCAGNCDDDYMYKLLEGGRTAAL